MYVVISIYGYPYMGSQGSLGWDTLGWDTLGGPMGPWDRWDLGTDGTWASRTLGLKDPRSTISIWISISIPVPDPRLPGPGAGYPAAGPGAGCRLPGRPFFETKQSVLQNFRVTEFPCNGIVVSLSPCVLFVSVAPSLTSLASRRRD